MRFNEYENQFRLITLEISSNCIYGTQISIKILRKKNYFLNYTSLMCWFTVFYCAMRHILKMAHCETKIGQS